MAHAARIGLDALVEAHDAASSSARSRSAPTRSGSTRATSRPSRSTGDAQLELVAQAPRDRVVIAESAIHSRAQGAAAELAGADAILVGTALMRAADPGAKLRELISRPLVKVCGLTREEDVAVAVEAGADLCGFILEPASPRAADRRARPCRTRRSRSRSSSASRRRRTPTSSSSTRARRARCAAATPCCCATASRSRRSSTSRGRRTTRRTSSARARSTGRLVLAGGLGPENVARRDRGGRGRGRSTPAPPRVEPRRQGPRERARVRGGRRDDRVQSYGGYGGRYVPETLIPALDELDRRLGARRRPTRRSPPSSTGSAASTPAARRR